MRVGARARYISKLAIYPKGIRRCQQREPNRHLTTYEYRDSIYGRASERVPLLTRGGYRERDGRPIPSPPPVPFDALARVNPAADTASSAARINDPARHPGSFDLRVFDVRTQRKRSLS